MQPRDWIDLSGLALAGFVAWQSLAIRAAIAELKTNLVDRIAAVEGDVKVLQATTGLATSHRPRVVNGRG